MSHENIRERDSRESFVSRRAVLRTSGTAIAGAGALLAGSSPVAAGDKKGGCDDPPWSFPRVTTRDHFETSNGVQLTDGNDEYNYEYAGDGIPGVHDPAPAELLVFVHGWNNDDEGAVCTFGDAAGTFSSEGYYNPVVGFSWDADHGWYDATEIAERNGAKLAYFTYSYKSSNPDVRVRYVAHSLGARVALMALKNLNHWDRPDDVTSVSILGGAADDDSVAMEGTYGEDISEAAGHVDNYWMGDDDVLNWAYGFAEWGEAVGNDGCDGTAPWNYTDYDVGYVPDHGSYYQDDGCVHEVVANF
ncbi:alpha/beta hydrolase [Halosolutus gelatinilyticus]|uniref:alpha/beta hydrolase n=1 Tax=Halosolutus gelatinilyticus TaxID=2931975 RepID=UPI001FF4C99B|nr:alpha/beta hydrolase [Halosolutus gelatinilyticus]